MLLYGPSYPRHKFIPTISLNKIAKKWSSSEQLPRVYYSQQHKVTHMLKFSCNLHVILIKGKNCMNWLHNLEVSSV